MDAQAKRNRDDITALTQDVKAVTVSVNKLATSMAAFADYKEDKAKLEGKIEQVTKETIDNREDIIVLQHYNASVSKSIDTFKKEQKQGIGFILAMLLGIIGKLIYQILGV